MYPGRAHYLASLPDQLEIARTSYRFYVAPNVWVFERGKLDYVGTRLVRQAFADQNRPALLRLFDIHDELKIVAVLEVGFKKQDKKTNFQVLSEETQQYLDQFRSHLDQFKVRLASFCKGVEGMCTRRSE